ncbi:hypothetical protein NN561_005179 [Cricetulus griseus]
MAHGALTVMQHNAAVSQPLGFSPAGLGTATRSLRPPPGPTQAQGSPWPLPCHAAVARCGVGRSRSPRVCWGWGGLSLWGRLFLPRLLALGDRGAPCSTDAGQSSWPADAGGSLMLRRDQRCREGLQKDATQRCTEAMVHSLWILSFSVHRP